TPMSTSQVINAGPAQADDGARLDALLDRINKLTTGPGVSQVAATPAAAAGPAAASRSAADPSADGDAWFPPEPDSLRAAGLTESEVEDLLLKFLIARSEATGRTLAEHVRLPFRLIDPLLQQLKQDRFVAHKGAAMMNDYVYILTELGRERGKKLTEHCTYFGSAPVPLEAYIRSVASQTLADQHPTEEDLHRAFSDLLIDKRMLRRLGPAINSGRGMFLFGAPGNGKTSIAERVTAAFGEHIWVPRAIGVDGEIMRHFDPSMHVEAPLEAHEGLIDNRKIDARWVRIERPTIVVGGELTMDSLEVTLNTATNVSEAPLQLKSNCGTLVIDDFGRQRMTTDELLNRWIVPLEKRYDFLNLSSGKKIQVPFDQLIVFSTNLEPKDLVDDAFLRRIPYKIEVTDPDEPSFRELLKIMAPIIGVAYDQGAVDYLVDTHYRAVGRPFRCCQPRDLLLQIRNFTRYVGDEPVMSPANFDFAVENYFAVM
ncbi:MAG: AAA family ATPase, partial [Planctomycetota bacterium]